MTSPEVASKAILPLLSFFFNLELHNSCDSSPWNSVRRSTDESRIYLTNRRKEGREGGEGRCGAGSKAVQLDPELRTIRGESRVGLTNSLLVNGTSISPIVDRRAWGCGRKPHAAFASSGIASVGSPSPSTDLSSLPSAVDTRGCRLRKTSSFPVSFLLRPSPSLSPEIWREDREREERGIA